MPVKIRLQRHGKKGKPYYWIVAADGRSKRDGRYLEKLGAYNPNTNPATIELDIDGAVKWMNNGAQPTDTARAILSYKGAMLKKHLAGGVAKGALTEEQAEKKFNAWLDEKAAKIQAKVDGLSKTEAEAKAKALEAEKAVNEARMAPPVVEEEVAEEVAEEASTEAAVEETAEVAEEATEVSSEEVAEVTEASSEETAEETKVAVEEVTEEVAESAEAKTEEAPAEEAEASNEEE
jgi:small subunit ribosomal protein S16